MHISFSILAENNLWGKYGDVWSNFFPLWYTNEIFFFEDMLHQCRSLCVHTYGFRKMQSCYHTIIIFCFFSSLIILFLCFLSVSFRVLIRSHSIVEMSILFVQVVVWTLCPLQEWFGSVFASKFKCTVWLTVCSQQLLSLGFRAKLLDAIDVLQQAADLDGASLDVRGQ